MRKPLTHLDFVQKLNNVNPNILVVGLYSRSNIKLLVKCAFDGFEWFSKPNNLLNGSGCPKCAGNNKKTHADFLSDLSNITSNILPLEQYTNANKKILVECVKDNYRWSVAPSQLLLGTGCPKCAGNYRKTHDDFVLEVAELHPDIEILGRYAGDSTKIEAYCKRDGFVWYPKPSDMLQGCGCPKCIGRHKTQEEFVSQVRSVSKNIEVVGDYKGSKHRVVVKCTVDGHVWNPVANKLLSGRGCPKCARYGFKQYLPATLYTYKFSNYYGFGITNEFAERDSKHRKTFNKLGIQAELIKTYEGSGQYILDMENHLKRNLPIYNTGIDGFKTEAVLEEDGILLFREIEKYMIDNI